MNYQKTLAILRRCTMIVAWPIGVFAILPACFLYPFIYIFTGWGFDDMLDHMEEVVEKYQHWVEYG